MVKSDIDPRAPIIGYHGEHTRYECPICGWDTLDEARMTEHMDPVRGRHMALPDAPPDATGAVNVPFYEHVLARYRDLIQIVAETQKGRDRLVKDGYAVVDENGDLWLAWGFEGVPDEPTGLAAKKSDDAAKDATATEGDDDGATDHS